MSRTPLLVLALAAGIVLLALWLFRTAPGAVAEREMQARRTEAAADGAAGEPAARPPAVTVEALAVAPAPARNRVEISCELEAVRHVVLGAELGGRVVSVEVEDHAVVAEGDVLVRLDPELARASVARSRAALQSAEARRELARSELARQLELSQKGVASAAELDRVDSEAQTAEASVAEAAAALLDAETRLAKTAIRAPFPGVVGAVDLEPGAYVLAGSRVAELADLSEIEIEVGVSDEEVLALREGQPVSLRVEALPGRRFEGRVLRPGRTPDASTRKYPVPIRVPNPDGELLPGMLGRVAFSLGEAREVLRVPRRAVQREYDLEYLFVLEAESDGVARAVRRRVRTRTVPFRPELLEIDTGLAAGDRVAVSGVRELRDGQRVRTREPASVGRLAPESEPAS